MNKLIIEVEVLTNISVMEIHRQKLEQLIKNYLRGQAYEEYEIKIRSVVVKSE